MSAFRRVRRWITLLLVLTTLAITTYVHVIAEGPFYLRPYAELKSLQKELEVNLHKMESTTVSEAQEVIHETALRLLRRDVAELKREIQWRQWNVLLVVITSAWIALITLFRLFYLLRYGRGGRVKGFYHRGKIHEEAPRVQYLHEDDLKFFLNKGFPDKRDAERWLRSDVFLKCWKCATPVAAETIGSVQEVILMEEAPRGTPQDRLQKFGAIWVCIPIDRFTCKKCGKELIRAAR
jgi:hypothetical protein